MKHQFHSIVGATTAVALATVSTAFVAQGSILVKDAFDASGYTVGTVLKNLSPGNTIGFTSKTWGDSNSTGVFFVNDGLDLPADFTTEAAGNAIGVGKFGSDPSNNPWGRRITRTINDNIIAASGTYFVRFACEIGAGAEVFLRENDFEALGLVPAALTNTGGIGIPPDFGVHLGFLKTAATGSTGTDLVIWTGGAKQLTLVENVTAGKTYLVVAKIELDGTSKALISALAGAADDNALRSATLPAATECDINTDYALRHLCLSGVYMTGDANGKYVTFDEFAVGTTLEDVWGFVDETSPVIFSTESTAIGETGFVANGTLSQLGSSDPELFFDVSDDAGATWTGTSMGTYSATGEISYPAMGLFSGSTYSWRFRAVNSSAASTSEVQVVTLAGVPVLGVPASLVSDTSATLSVSLETPGLSGVVDTRVTLWFAEQGSPLELQKTFDGVSVAATFEETVSGLTYGKTYIYAFKASVPYNGGTLDAWTSTNTVEILGEITWSNGAETEDWNSSENWTPALVPTALLTAKFTSVGGDVTASADGAATNLLVDTGLGKDVAIDFGQNTLSGTYLGVGNTVKQSSLALARGIFNFNTIRIGGSTYGQSSLTVGTDAKLVGGDFFLGYDAANSLSNMLTFASGSSAYLSGTLGVRGGHYNQAVVEKGASVNVGGILLRSSGVRMIVDGGAVTNSGTTVVLSQNLAGTIADSIVLEFKNGATAKLDGKMAINAARNNAANHAYVHGELRVLDGSSVSCGDSVFIDNNAFTAPAGPNDDQPANGAKVIVSNATFSATSISICNDGRHNSDELLIFEDDGQKTKVSTSGSVRVAAAGPNNSAVVNYNNRILLEGGELAISQILHIGDNGPYYASHTNNHVIITRENSVVTAKSLNVYGVGYVAFRIPKGGFNNVPMQVSETASFGEIPEKDSIKIYQAAEWNAVSTVQVDVDEFIGEQTLITAGLITGLTADRIIVNAPKSKKITVTLDSTSLSVKISPSATMMIFR